MRFKTLSVETWQQFEQVDIDFHPRLTILTGANGCGKTTLLKLLAQHRGWPSVQVATPAKNKVTGVIEFFTRRIKGKDKSSDSIIGKLSYTSGQEATLIIPDAKVANYQINISNLQAINCFFIPSHRQTFRYEPVQNIPVTKKTEQTAFDEVYSVGLQRHNGGHSQSASFFIKNTLIGWAIQGYGIKGKENKVVMPADSAQLNAFEGFEQTLKKLLPASLGFSELEIRGMEIVFICNDGEDEFILETASGGVSAIIDLAWQIYMFSKSNPDGFTVIIDEAENHLHPSLQRALLPNLLAAFPSATFIVSTHSPLVVGSVREANVYALTYNEQKKVVSLKLDLEDKAKTATEILDEVLGVSSSLPIWVENELSKILSEVTRGGLTDTTFSTLRKRLDEAGLGNLLPEAITASVNQKK